MKSCIQQTNEELCTMLNLKLVFQLAWLLVSVSVFALVLNEIFSQVRGLQYSDGIMVAVIIPAAIICTVVIIYGTTLIEKCMTKD